MKGRIIFVGVHNKQGLKPLDSKSVSGKRIDKIIEGLGSMPCVKSNLYDSDRLPTNLHEKEELKMLWRDKYDPSSRDIIVLLGSMVHKEFPIITGNEIKVAHPSLQWSKMKPEIYIQKVIALIKEQLN